MKTETKNRIELICRILDTVCTVITLIALLFR